MNNLLLVVVDHPAVQTIADCATCSTFLHNHAELQLRCVLRSLTLQVVLRTFATRQPRLARAPGSSVVPEQVCVCGAPLCDVMQHACDMLTGPRIIPVERDGKHPMTARGGRAELDSLKRHLAIWTLEFVRGTSSALQP